MTQIDAASAAMSANPDVCRMASIALSHFGACAEGVDDVLGKLLSDHPAEVNQALDGLSLDERARALVSIGEAEILKIEPSSLANARIAMEEARAPPGSSRQARPRCCASAANGTMQVTTRRRAVTGTLTVSGPGGAKTDFKVRTGGWGGASYLDFRGRGPAQWLVQGRDDKSPRRRLVLFPFETGYEHSRTWTNPHRVVVKIEWHPGAPRVGFIVTTWRDRLRMSSPSTTSAGPANKGSKRARARSNGPGCPAVRSPQTPSGFSFMPSPIISATSCARSLRPSRSKTGR